MRYGDGMSEDLLQNALVRLEALESRFAFQEDLVRQLDDVVRTQANKIDALEREIVKMRTELTHEPESEAPPEEQVPPHY